LKWDYSLYLNLNTNQMEIKQDAAGVYPATYTKNGTRWGILFE
jgi:hypothetical protein